MITRDDLIQQARSYKGTKWLENGYSEFGLDCIGFIALPAEDLGIAPPEMIAEIKQKYEAYASSPRLYRAMNKYLQRIDFEDIKTADILLFKQLGIKYPTHIAYYIEDYKVIHCAAKFKGVVETTLSPKLNSQRVAAFRIPYFVENEE